MGKVTDSIKSLAKQKSIYQKFAAIPHPATCLHQLLTAPN